MSAVKQVPILLYHSVCDSPVEGIERWNVTPSTFRSHLEAIAERGCETLTVSEYAARLRDRTFLAEGTVLVTFDDGFAGVGLHAVPALAELGMTSTLYVTTGGLSDRTDHRSVHLPQGPMISSSELADLEASGVEIGAHSHTHPELDVQGKAMIRDEIVRSKAILEESLGHEIASFAYPHGYSNAFVRERVSEVGFTSACGVRNAFSSVLDDQFSLSRLTVESSTSLSEIGNWLEGRGAPLGCGRERRRTQVWRTYRRARRMLSAHGDHLSRRTRRPS